MSSALYSDHHAVCIARFASQAATSHRRKRRTHCLGIGLIVLPVAKLELECSFELEDTRRAICAET
jgi:hypothetical protein